MSTEQQNKVQVAGEGVVHAEQSRPSNEDYIPPGGRNPLKWTVSSLLLQRLSSSFPSTFQQIFTFIFFAYFRWKTCTCLFVTYLV